MQQHRQRDLADEAGRADQQDVLAAQDLGDVEPRLAGDRLAQRRQRRACIASGHGLVGALRPTRSSVSRK